MGRNRHLPGVSSTPARARPPEPSDALETGRRHVGAVGRPAPPNVAVSGHAHAVSIRGDIFGDDNHYHYRIAIPASMAPGGAERPCQARGQVGGDDARRHEPVDWFLGGSLRAGPIRRGGRRRALSCRPRCREPDGTVELRSPALSRARSVGGGSAIARAFLMALAGCFCCRTVTPVTPRLRILPRSETIGLGYRPVRRGQGVVARFPSCAFAGCGLSGCGTGRRVCPVLMSHRAVPGVGWQSREREQRTAAPDAVGCNRHPHRGVEVQGPVSR